MTSEMWGVRPAGDVLAMATLQLWGPGRRAPVGLQVMLLIVVGTRVREEGIGWHHVPQPPHSHSRPSAFSEQGSEDGVGGAVQAPRVPCRFLLPQRVGASHRALRTWTLALC